MGTWEDAGVSGIPILNQTFFTGILIQGFMQALYHLSHSSSPFRIAYFGDKGWGSLEFFLRLASSLKPLNLCLLSS
jgi:hypothetical protein